MKKNARRLGVISIVLLIFLLGANVAVAGGPVAVDEWILPTLAVKTGPIAFAGLPFHWAADYAAKEINASGGIRGVPLKIVHYDSAFPDMAKTAAVGAKAIPGALLINGPMIYPEVAAISQLIVDAKVANINAATIPMFLEQMAPYALGQLQSMPKGHVGAGLRWLNLNPDIKTVAIIYDANQPELVQTLAEVMKAYENVEIKVVPCETAGADQFDFSSAVLKAIRSKADGFQSFLLDFQTAAIAKELHNRGVNPGTAILSGYSSNGPALFSTGKGYLENSYIWDNFNVVDTTPAYRKLSEDFAKDFNGMYVGTSTISSLDAVYAFKIAVETLEITGDPAKLAEERKEIVDFLYNSPNLPGALGTYQYHYVKGEKIAPYFLLQIRNNRFEYVDTLPQ